MTTADLARDGIQLSEFRSGGGTTPQETYMRENRKVLVGAATLVGFAAGLVTASPGQGRADTVTACTTINLCYCINTNNRDVINTNITRVRQLIIDQRSQGKAIGYLSIPLSTAGGAYFGVNVDVAKETKERIEKRFGPKSVWMLNPGAEGNLPAGASGADYMLMWTKILEGRSGLGEDFDFFYFVGPSDFAKSFNFDGTGDMEKIEAYFDKRYATDQKFKEAVDQNKISKKTFRNYYALHASVSFSYGSHDEWNIARLLNERRRGSADYGIANQLGVLFDGRAATPGDFEAADASGDVGRCIN
jgi:hypothetical protein